MRAKRMGFPGFAICSKYEYRVVDVWLAGEQFQQENYSDAD